MNKVVNVIFSNGAICAYEGAILGAVFVRYLKLRKEKKRAQEMSTIQKEKVREKNLDQKLKNKHYQGGKEKIVQNNIPYEIEFHEESGKKRAKGDNIAIQIIETGKLSTRKYVIFISDMITIGQSANNAFVTNDGKVAKEQCQIFKNRKDLYIRALEEMHPVKIVRKRDAILLTRTPVKILNGDSIEMGETTLKIQFI